MNRNLFIGLLLILSVSCTISAPNLDNDDGIKTVSTIAGTAGSYGSNDNDAAGLEASFYHPCGITTDGTFLYVVDSSNGSIRKIEISTGIVTTIATGLSSPYGITIFEGYLDDYLYVSEFSHHQVKEIKVSDGSITVYTGYEDRDSSDGIDYIPGDMDGSQSSNNVRLRNPSGLIFFGNYLYVADTGNGKIKKIHSTGWSQTVVDGLESPRGITTDGTYFYTTSYDKSIIQKSLIPSGTDITTDIETIAGGSDSGDEAGYLDSTGTDALFDTPVGILYKDNFLYIADKNNHCIRKLDLSNNSVITLAGSSDNEGNPISGSTNSSLLSSSFNNPFYMVFDDNNNLFITDYDNHLIRCIK